MSSSSSSDDKGGCGLCGWGQTSKCSFKDATSLQSVNVHIAKEEVLFKPDTLSRIISYLPSVDLPNLALTSKRFCSSNDDGKLSLIKESTCIAIQDIATEEQLATLPYYYNGKNPLANYHYIQFMRGPLTFDQLIECPHKHGGAEYVNVNDKSWVRHGGDHTLKIQSIKSALPQCNDS